MKEKKSLFEMKFFFHLNKEAREIFQLKRQVEIEEEEEE